MNINNLKYYLYSILLNAGILFAVHSFVQPDPKGLAFGLFITFYGIATSIAGLYAIKQVAINTVFYTWIAAANLINIYFLFRSIRDLLLGSELMTPRILFELFFVVGAFLAVYMAYRLLKEGAKG